MQYADVVELVDTLVLEASASAWEFESPHPHQSGLFQPGGAAPSSCPSASLRASFLFFRCISYLSAIRHAFVCAIFLPEIVLQGRARTEICLKNGQIEVNQRFFG